MFDLEFHLSCELEVIESTKTSSIEGHGTRLLDIKWCHVLESHSRKCDVEFNLYCRLCTLFPNKLTTKYALVFVYKGHVFIQQKG